MRFNFIKKLLVASAIASTAVIFSACSETSVIEAENEILSEHKGPKKGLLDSLEANLGRVDLYNCLATYSKERCSNFYKKFGSYDCPQISNPYYNDKGEYTYDDGSKDATGNVTPQDTSNVTPKDTVVEVYYLQENKNITITLKSFKQKSDKASNPMVRFKVELYSDSVKANTLSTGVLPLELEEKKWRDTTSFDPISVVRGIDEIRICPVVISQTGDDEEDEIVSSGRCMSAKDIGYIKDTETFLDDEDNDDYAITWEAKLY